MNDRFGDIAVAAGLISHAQLKRALLFQRLSDDPVHLGRLLYDMKYMSLENVSEILAHQRTMRCSDRSPASKTGPEPVSRTCFGRYLETAGGSEA